MKKDAAVCKGMQFVWLNRLRKNRQLLCETELEEKVYRGTMLHLLAFHGKNAGPFLAGEALISQQSGWRRLLE
jgi:hypothetical protein